MLVILLAVLVFFAYCGKNAVLRWVVMLNLVGYLLAICKHFLLWAITLGVMDYFSCSGDIFCVLWWIRTTVVVGIRVCVIEIVTDATN